MEIGWFPARPGKIFVQLLLCLLQQGRFHHPAWQRLQLRRTVRAKMYPAQCVVFLLQTDGTKDAVDVPDVQKTNASFLARMCYTDGILTQNQP